MGYKVIYTKECFYEIYYGNNHAATCPTWGEVVDYMDEHNITVYDFYYERR